MKDDYDNNVKQSKVIEASRKAVLPLPAKSNDESPHHLHKQSHYSMLGLPLEQEQKLLMAHLVLDKLDFEQLGEVYEELFTVKQIHLLFDKPFTLEKMQILDNGWLKHFIREIDDQILAQLPCDSEYKHIAGFFGELHQEIIVNIIKVIANADVRNNAHSDALQLNSEIKIAVRKCLKQAAQPFTSDDPIKRYLLLLVSHLMELSIIPQNVIKLFPHTVTISLSQPRSLPEVMEDYISKAKGMTMVIKM